MALFGWNGFVIGPVVAAMFIAVWHLFTEARLGETAPADGSGTLPGAEMGEPVPANGGVIMLAAATQPGDKD